MNTINVPISLGLETQSCTAAICTSRGVDGAVYGTAKMFFFGFFWSMIQCFMDISHSFTSFECKYSFLVRVQYVYLFRVCRKSYGRLVCMGTIAASVLLNSFLWYLIAWPGFRKMSPAHALEGISCGLLFITVNKEYNCAVMYLYFLENNIKIFFCFISFSKTKSRVI